MELRDKLLKALYSHAAGHLQKHKANIEVYLANPAGIGEHPDIVAAVDTQISKQWKKN
mgnify:CR=1 FL=1